MISFNEAYKLVKQSTIDFGTEVVSIHDCVGRILAENIVADRDFPPFDRVTKDGIAISFDSFNNGQNSFKIEGIAAAGSPQTELKNNTNCIEVMTGAMLPTGTDTVIMYEQLEIKTGIAEILSQPVKGQNIHYQGSDRTKDSVLLEKYSKIKTSTIGILATVGKSEIRVKKLPKVAIISTGNELVPISETPEPHQIRSSNSVSLQELLKQKGINADIFHILDDKKEIKKKFESLISEYDVLMMSGGVSMGKFDFLPEVLQEIGATNIFHKVAQRPGKPFWFGQHAQSKTTIFSFPGNPVSTFVNYHLYFTDWLDACLNQTINEHFALLKSDFENPTDLTRFTLVKAKFNEGKIEVELINDNGSGDLVSLANASGVIKFPSKAKYSIGDLVNFIPF